MNCPICSAPPIERFRSAHVSVLKCGACGHLYAADPAPDQGVQHLPDPEAVRREFGERNERLVRWWRMTGLLADSGGILDIGSGAGHIVEAIRDQLPAARIVCLEADCAAAADLAARGFRVAENFASLADETFDTILLVEVIEHVNDPVALLRQCRALLAPGGRIFLTTPCGETTSGKRTTNAYDTKEHVHFFTERSLRSACATAGFAHLDFLSPSLLRVPGRGLGRTVAFGKALARPLRDMVTGRQHLVCAAR